MNKLYQPKIVRVDLDTSHYYTIDGEYYPNVTSILHDSLPMAPELRKWLGNVGNEKADKLLDDAAKRGTRVHNACEALLLGHEVYLNRDLKDNDERKCVVGFQNWQQEFLPIIPDIKDIDGLKKYQSKDKKKTIEITLASRHKFAGTLDIFCYIEGEPWIVDIKTSSGVYDSHMLQIIAYQQAFFEMTGIMPKLGILHLRPKTRAGFTFVDKIEIAKRPLEFGDFMKVFAVYKMLNGGEVKRPGNMISYPDILKPIM